MGTRPLLDREGEVALAQRLDEGRERVTRAVYRTPLALRTVLEQIPVVEIDPETIEKLGDCSDDEGDAVNRCRERLREAGEELRGLWRMWHPMCAMRLRPSPPRTRTHGY